MARGGRRGGRAGGGGAGATALGAGDPGGGPATAARRADAVVLRGRDVRRRNRPGRAVPGAARPLRERPDARCGGTDDAGAGAGDARRAPAHGRVRDRRRRRGRALQRQDRQPAHLPAGAQPGRDRGDRGRRGAGRHGGGVGLRGGHRDRSGARHRGERAGRPHREPADARGDGPPVGRHGDGLPAGARAVRRHPLPRQRPAGRGVGRRLRLRGAGGPAERRVRGAAADDHERGLRAVLRPAAARNRHREHRVPRPDRQLPRLRRHRRHRLPADEPLFDPHRRQRRGVLVAAAPHHQHAPEDRHPQPVAVHGRHPPRRLARGQGLHRRRRHRPRPPRRGRGAARALQRGADRHPP